MFADRNYLTIDILTLHTDGLFAKHNGEDYFRLIMSFNKLTVTTFDIIYDGDEYWVNVGKFANHCINPKDRYERMDIGLTLKDKEWMDNLIKCKLNELI